MKFFFIILLQLAISANFLEAQGADRIQNPVVLRGKRKVMVMRQQEWSRGYAKGSVDRQKGTGYNDIDPAAAKKGIPTSEAFQSGYQVGYTQKQP